jgi:hypothetical protein
MADMRRRKATMIPTIMPVLDLWLDRDVLVPGVVEPLVGWLGAPSDELDELLCRPVRNYDGKESIMHTP